jgi:CheY-like chemotaxis protein
LLAFARRKPIERQVFDAAVHLERLADMLKTVLGSPSTFELQLSDQPMRIDVDVNQFDTALLNLVANARDAMNGEGTLRIRGEPRQDGLQAELSGHAPQAFVAISVSDTGCGIPPDQIDRIFEPFFTTKDVGRGTGLGLSQVYGFVHQSGGRVDVRSEVGRGTTLTLHLPLSTKPIQMRDVSPTDTPNPRERWNVLVVEDNLEVGEFSTQLLQDLGYQTVLARDGAEALRLLDANPGGFDIVLSDVVMPGMDGVALGKEIRRRLPTVPVVLNSGYSHVLADGDRHGFDLVHKPYSVEELSRVLRQAMARNGSGRSTPSAGA